MQIDVFRDGVRLGNFDPDEAPELLKAGKLLPTDLVQGDGGLVPITAALDAAKRSARKKSEVSSRSSGHKTGFAELQTYEKIRDAVESPICSFLKPFQI